MILSSPDPASDPYVAAALLALQHAAFEVEASHLGTRELPPLQEDVVGLTAFRGRWITAWDGTELVGAISYWWSNPSTPHDEAEIDRVMVHPDAFRRGIASLLIGRLVERVPEREIVVTTGRDNPPGIAMYRKHGFDHDGDPFEAMPDRGPGVWLTQLRRPA